MKCPVCKNMALRFLETNDLPRRSVCPQCGGQWIKGSQYRQWVEALGEDLPETPSTQAEQLEVSDSIEAKLCPDCGRFLRRSRVGHGIDFHIDRCSTCGGIWFDKNEWEILKSHNLHDDVHFIFSSAWQHAVVEEEQRATYEKRIETILGADDFATVSRFKAWVQKHPKRNTIMAFMSGLDV